MNDEIERLLQDEADGVATPEQLDRLRGLLATEPAARERRREVAAVFQALERVEMEEAPDLRHSVLDAIGREGQAPAPHRLWAGLRAVFERRPGVSLAYAFGAGAIVSAVAIALATGTLSRAPSAPSMTGTMARPADAEARRELEVAGATVVFEAQRRGDRLEVLVATGAAPDARVTLEFEPAALQLAGLRWGQPGPGAAGITRGHIVLEPRAADCRIEFTLAGPPSPLVVVVDRAGGTARGTLDVTAPEETP